MQKSNFLLTLTLLAMSIWTNAAFAEPAITGASATGTTIKFTVQLSEKLFSGYKVKIDLQNGKGFVAMKCSALTCTLSSNALPKGVDDASYSVGIYDSKGALQGEIIDSSYVITATAEVNAVPPASQVNTVPTSTTGTIKTDMPVPSITNASASPSAITQGSSLTFSAVLSSNLPSSYSVKLSYGNTSVYMSGSGTNYSVVQTPSQFGQQIFTVGIYDANNTLKSNSMTGNFEIVKANTFPTLSFMSGNTTATVGTSYSVQLQGNDNDNNLSLITINWGDGSSNSQNASNGSTLTFSHTYSSANSSTWSATAIDSANASSSAVSKTVSVSAAVVTPPVTSTSGYSKIANNGSTLSDSAQLGANSNDWACTKDNKTGLIWEVKTTDGGLRDYQYSYSWYEPDTSKNGGDAGYQNRGTCKGSQCDTYAFTNAVNANSLCGKNDWRMPTVEELKGLLTKTRTVNQPLNNLAYIDATYFPNTTNYWFWSSSPNAGSSYGAWGVDFSYGHSGYDGKYGGSGVRLVRG